MTEYKIINCRFKDTYLSKGTFLRANREIVTLNGVDYIRPNKVRLEPTQLRLYPVFFARKHDLWHLVEISQEDMEYVKSFPVADSMRIQQYTNKAGANPFVVGDNAKASPVEEKAATESVEETPKPVKRRRTKKVEEPTDE